MLSKIAAQESHGAPPGTYLMLFWVTFWPAAPLAALAAPAVWRARREPGAQYLLAWLMPSWIMFTTGADQAAALRAAAVSGESRS